MSLTETEMEVLHDLAVNGDNVPSNIAENTGRHPKSVSRSLSGETNSLESRGYVRNKGRGVWTITGEGRSELNYYVSNLIDEEKD